MTHYNHQYILNGKQYKYCVKCGEAFSQFRKFDCRSAPIDRDDTWIHKHSWKSDNIFSNIKLCKKCGFELIDKETTNIPCAYPDDIIQIKEIIE